MGGGDRRAEGNKFEFEKDLMESHSEENFCKGNANDVLSATEGNTTSRGSGGICDWGREEESRDLDLTREAKGNESGASFSWLASVRPRP